MDPIQTRNILEACLLVAGRPMSTRQLSALFEDDIDKPARSDILEVMAGLQAEYEGRGIELVEVASGWRLQSRNTMEHWVSRLFEEKSPRYSRALLETLVLIAYRQPVTRGEIEEVRGVAVSSNIIRTLQERQWVREVGHKDVPGKPALLGTTREFLDYFNLKQLEDLPPLGAVMDMEQVEAVLAAEIGLVEGASNSVAANDESGDNTEGSEEAETHNEIVDGDEIVVDNDGIVSSDESVEAAVGTETDSNASAEPVVGESVFGESVASESVTGESVTGESVASESVTSESAASDQDVSSGAADANGSGEIDSAGSNKAEMRESSEIDSAAIAEVTEDQEVIEDQEDAAEANEPETGELETGELEANKPEANEAVARADDNAESVSDARAQLRQVIDDFATEHQQEIDARDEFEARNLPSRTPFGSDDDSESDPSAELGADEVPSSDVDSNESARAVSQNLSVAEPGATLAVEKPRPEPEAVVAKETVSAMASRPAILRIVRNEPQEAPVDTSTDAQVDEPFIDPERDATDQQDTLLPDPEN